MKIQAKHARVAWLVALVLVASAAALSVQALPGSAFGLPSGAAHFSQPTAMRGFSSADAAQNAQAPAASPESQTTAPSKDSVTVWVNTETGVYHKPGSRYYGKTKKGKYMLEADALKAGYKPAKAEKRDS